MLWPGHLLLLLDQLFFRYCAGLKMPNNLVPQTPMSSSSGVWENGHSTTKFSTCAKHIICQRFSKLAHANKLAAQSVTRPVTRSKDYVGTNRE